MTVDIQVTLPDGTTRSYPNVTLSMGPHWIDILQKDEDRITLNFCAWSLTEKVPEKIKIRKRDGAILDDGYRSCGSFEGMTIRRRRPGGGR